MPERRGRFITFEGTDGSGKTTQMVLLADRLQSSGYDVIQTQEPGGTICPTAEMLLYFAARAQNFDQVILPAWESGAIVLSDRFTDSTLAYQGEGRGLGANVVMTLHDIACHGLQPDLTLCIDVDLETALRRTSARNTADRMEQQAAEFHERVRNAYLRLGAEHPDRIRIIDGRGSMEEVAQRVWNAAEPIVKRTHV
jgi:dTMP kinase